MPKSKLTVEKLKRRIWENDPNLSESSKSFKAALLSFAAAKLGHLDRVRIVEFTGMPTDHVGELGGCLIADAGSMPYDSMDRSWHRSPDGLDFWLLASVATGDLERERQGGEYKYRVTDLGEDNFKAMILNAAH